MKKISFLIILSLLSAQTMAHPAYPCRTHEVSYVQKSEALKTSECFLEIPLNLTEADFYLPSYSQGKVKVRFWEGKFVKNILLKFTNIWEEKDRCTGETLNKRTWVSESAISMHYYIHNPNLNQPPRHSWDLLPMTDHEAVEALNETKSRCENDKSYEFKDLSKTMNSN